MWAVFDQLKGLVTFAANLEGLEDLPRDRRHLLIVDDTMVESGDKILKLFTKGSHNRNMSIVYIVQILFNKGKHHRTISLNTHYLICFKNPRDSMQIQTLARQIFLGRSQLVLKAFALATDRAHGYLLFDFRQEIPDRLRMRTLPKDIDLPEGKGARAFSTVRWREEEKELEA